MAEAFNVPVLFIIFNRPVQTQKTFDAIRAIQPKELFVAADGQRENNEEDKLNIFKCREIVHKIDWDCNISYLFREKNMGCKMAVSESISWFFSHVEMGIILEDDCLPNQSFFHFCNSLLHKYRHDPLIMHIGGTNFQPVSRLDNQSYYFSRVAHVWGWASWKRAWDKYNVTISGFSEQKLQQWFDEYDFEYLSYRYFKNVFRNVLNGKIDTWDYQWTYAIWENKGLCIIPEVNMISNIGFDSGGTHTSESDSEYANMPVYELNELIHPKEIIVDKVADKYIFKKWFVKRTLLKRISNKIKKLSS